MRLLDSSVHLRSKGGIPGPSQDCTPHPTQRIFQAPARSCALLVSVPDDKLFADGDGEIDLRDVEPREVLLNPLRRRVVSINDSSESRLGGQVLARPQVSEADLAKVRYIASVDRARFNVFWCNRYLDYPRI
jgi:hypothetical protein